MQCCLHRVVCTWSACTTVALSLRLNLPPAVPTCAPSLSPTSVSIPQAWTFTAAENCKERFPGAPGCCFLKKGTGYEKRSAPGMVSGTSGGRPVAACTLEFDTDFLGGDIQSRNGAVFSFFLFFPFPVEERCGVGVAGIATPYRAGWGKQWWAPGAVWAAAPAVMVRPRRQERHASWALRRVNPTLIMNRKMLFLQEATQWCPPCQTPTAAKAAQPPPAAGPGPWALPATVPTACPAPAAAASSRCVVGAWCDFARSGCLLIAVFVCIDWEALLALGASATDG